MPPAELRAISDRVTVMSLAPSPTPLACALASLPMPMAVCPRLTNAEPVNVMPSAAETWTAAGFWFQCGRADSNWRQPFWHDVIRSAGQSQVPAR